MAISQNRFTIFALINFNFNPIIVMTKLHYELLGEKNSEVAPLYCVHTVPLDSTYFKNSLNDITPQYQIVLLDLPGHGKSDDPAEEEFSFTDMADDIEAVRSELGHEKISMLGHGVGGFVTFEYALKYGEHIEKIILLNTAPNSKYRETMAWNIRDQYSKVVKQSLEPHTGKTDDKSLRIRFTQSLATYFSPSSHELAKQLMDSTERIATESYVYISRFLLPMVNYRERIRSIEQPVLILASTKDVWPDTASQLIRNDIIHANYDEFKTGHFPMIVEPSLFWNKISSFVNN